MPPETTWDQSGPTPIWGASVSYFFTPDLEVTFQYSKVEGGFGFFPNGDSQSGQTYGSATELADDRLENGPVHLV